MPTARDGIAYGSFDNSPFLSTASSLATSAGAPTPLGTQVVPTLPTGKATATPTHIWATLGGIVALLVVIRYASEHEKSGMDPAFLGVGAYNLVAVSLMAILGIAVTKTLVNKYPIKGLTDIVNIV